MMICDNKESHCHTPEKEESIRGIPGPQLNKVAVVGSFQVVSRSFYMNSVVKLVEAFASFLIISRAWRRL